MSDKKIEKNYKSRNAVRDDWNAYINIGHCCKNTFKQLQKTPIEIQR